MKRRRHLSQEFRTEWRFLTDKKKKSESLAVIRQAVREKRVRYQPSFVENVWSQMRYQPWSHWALNGGILFLAMVFAIYLPTGQADEREILTVCSVFFTFAGNMVLSNMGRLFSWHMAELEQTLYLNLKQMVCIRMLEAGIVDLTVLGIFFSIVGEGGSAAETGMRFVYMLVPFLWSDTLYLLMLIFFRNIVYRFRFAAAGILCGMLACLPLVLRDVYAWEYRWIWCFLAAAGVILFVLEIRFMLEKIEGGDSICLN